MTANWYNRITAALLAALCVCATACSGGDPADTTAAPAVTTAPVAEVTEVLRARTDTDYGSYQARIREQHQALMELCAD